MVVQANGRDDFSMYPESMAFGQVTKGGTPKSTIQVTLVGEPNWTITELKPESNYVKPVAKLIKRNGAEVTYEITASLRSDLPVGKWYTDIWLQTNSPNLAKVRIPLTVDVNAPVSATPSVIQLGDVKVGGSAEQNVLVKGEKPFRIKAVKGGESLLKVSGIDREAKAVHVLRFTFKPEKSGEINRAVSIVTDDSEEPAVTIPVHGKGVNE
jgi:hypothetical protein